MSLIKTISRNATVLGLTLLASAATADPAAAWFGGTGTKCADFDADGEVGSRDLAALLAEYGATTKNSPSGIQYSRCNACEFDINSDGVVDEQDIDELIEQWGSNGCATTQEEASCSADVNRDGVVSNRDLAIVLSEYGLCPESEADLNDDGMVDAADRDLLMKHWGESSCAGSAVGSTDVSCRADFDEDGNIGADDLAELLNAYGDYSCPSDFNGDGRVDDEDVGILLDRWGTECDS